MDANQPDLQQLEAYFKSLLDNSDIPAQAKLILCQNGSMEKMETQIIKSVRNLEELKELIPTNVRLLGKEAMAKILEKFLNLQNDLKASLSSNPTGFGPQRRGSFNATSPAPAGYDRRDALRRYSERKRRKDSRPERPSIRCGTPNCRGCGWSF